MAAPSARRGRGGFDPWPGYVDALSTLLMVIIFVLMVFVLTQAFLSVALSGRDQALARLNRQIAELSDLLALERGTSDELRQSVARLSSDLRAAVAARDALNRDLAAAASERDRSSAERDALRTDRDRLAALLADASLRAEAAANRVARLESQLAEALTRADQARIDADERARDAASARDTAEQRARDLAAALLLAEQRARDLAAVRQQAETRAQDLTATREEAERRARELAETALLLSETRRQLEAERQTLARMREEIARLDREVTTGRETIEMRLSEIVRLTQQIEALTALRDRLEQQAADAAARSTSEEERRRAVEAMLEEERRLGETARAQVALLNRQIEELRAQIGRISEALDLAEAEGRDKDVQIANLGERLNMALAARVEELQRYRSEFFGRLREVLGNREGIQVVGDRFVFQSEVLFPTGSAELQPEGIEQMRRIAGVIREIAREIPPDVPWILRVDGHADRTPINPGGRFTSNWELSAARAINVVRLLALLGVPENRLAATGFGEYQPIDPADTPEAYARNRRIELRLTDR
jgi:chemotaxis protein MotB